MKRNKASKLQARPVALTASTPRRRRPRVIEQQQGEPEEKAKDKYRARVDKEEGKNKRRLNKMI